MKITHRWLAAGAALIAVGGRAMAADLSSPAMPFVVSLTQDTAGCVWVGTEDQGVFRYDPSAGNTAAWTNFTTKDGLGDNNAYALCADKLGRIWVGHLNHGVSVYNGESWKNYDVLDGPIGERVFSIASDPVSGDIWIATSAGLTRFVSQGDSWSHVTRFDGLPSDQVQCVAVDSRGNVYAGTQFDGLAILPAKRQRKWVVIRGPDSPPAAPSGNGLPSNMINCILPARDGTIYIGTVCGLAASKDGGKTWSFVRGADWGAKVTGMTEDGGKGWREPQATFLLAEDYCTCIAEDDSGLLWVGHRRTGAEAIDPRVPERKQAVEPAKSKEKAAKDYAFAICTRSGGPSLVGWYGAGLTQDGASPPSTVPTPWTGRADAFPPSPIAAGAPTLAELNDALALVAKAPLLKAVRPTAAALDDDWRTQGDWLGRYGRYWACLSACCAPDDYIWGAGKEPVLYEASIGPNHTDPDDSLRYWVHWLYTTEPRSLELPPTYFDKLITKGEAAPERKRREAEWDDHGEAYPPTLDGPDLYCNLKIPAGQFYLSLYDFNKDGHEGANRFRDYPISVRYHNNGNYETYVGDFDREPELARGRIRDFWGGVWKRYFVQGPGSFTIRLKKNNSLNTILPAVMVDLVDEFPAPYFRDEDESETLIGKHSDGRTSRFAETSEDRAKRSSPAATVGEAADRLFDELRRLRLRNAPLWAAAKRSYYVLLARWYRQANATDAPKHRAEKLATCYYELGLYQQWENELRARGVTSAREVEKSLQWDEASFSDQGWGFRIVSEKVSSPRKKPSGTAGPRMP